MPDGEIYKAAGEAHLRKAEEKVKKKDVEGAESQYVRAAEDFLDAADEFESAGDSLEAGRMYLEAAKAYAEDAKLNQAAKTAGDDREAKNAFQKAIDAADKARKVLVGVKGGTTLTSTATNLIKDALDQKDKDGNKYDLKKP